MVGFQLLTPKKDFIKKEIELKSIELPTRF